jgi:hypothetical protein
MPRLLLAVGPHVRHATCTVLALTLLNLSFALVLTASITRVYQKQTFLLLPHALQEQHDSRPA